MALMSPEQLASPGTEHAHQTAIFQWVAVTGVKRCPHLKLLFAIPNGANYGGNSSVGARMKAEGLKSGVPDMFLPWHPLIPYSGLWMELKKPGAHTAKNGDRSDKQVQWHQDLRKGGWPVVTVYGWRAAVRALLLHSRCELSFEGEDCLFLWEGCPEMPNAEEETW